MINEAGIETIVASPGSGSIKGWKDGDWGESVSVDCTFENVAFEGRTVTSWSFIRTDLRNAGAQVIDQEVVVDGNLITSRNPDDIPLLSKAVNAAVKKHQAACH